MKIDTLRLNLTARKTALAARAKTTAQEVIFARERLRRLEQAASAAQGALDSHLQTVAEIEALAVESAKNDPEPSAQPTPAAAPKAPVEADPAAPAQ